MTKKGRFLVAAMLTLLMVGQAFAYEALTGPTGTLYWDKKKASNGYTLYYPEQGTDTYLIDMQGNLVNKWPGVGNPMLTEDGYLFGIFGDRHNYSNPLVLMDWKGKIVQKFIAPGNSTEAKIPGIVCSDGVTRQTVFHHEWRVAKKKDGSQTVFILARVLRSKAEIEAAGFTCGDLVNGFGAVKGWADTDAVLEFDMDGNLVWQWEFWDRMIQNQNPSGTHYSADITAYDKYYVPQGKAIGGDFVHGNSVFYNPERDELLLNPFFMDSFYVFKHNITTEEAQGAAGNFVYRWGDPSEYNPAKYPAGIKTVNGKSTWGKNDSQIGGSHTVHWIPEGLPGEGNFLLFSNAGSKAGSFTGSPFLDGASAIVEINPYTTDASTYNQPKDNWKTAPYVRQDQAGVGTKSISKQVVMYFTPQYAWGTYERQGFYSWHISGVQRMPNGNTMVISGESGHIFEITPTKTGDWNTDLLCMKSDVVWDFVNPYCMPRANDVKALTAADPHYTPTATLYKYRPAGVDGQVFRAWRYSPNFSGFKGKKLKPLGPLNDPKKWNKYFKGFGFGGGISVGGGGAGGAGTGGIGAGY